jgi:hypothetical protein
LRIQLFVNYNIYSIYTTKRKRVKMKKKIKFNKNQEALISKALDNFKNNRIKTVADSYFGGSSSYGRAVDPPISHSKGTYTQSYSRYTL